MKKLEKLTLGADPELFLVNEETNEIVSAIEKVPGTKQNPFKPSDLDSGFAMQTDNILVEFNIPPVDIQDKEGFINNLLKMRDYINIFVKRFDENYTVRAMASGIVNSSELNDPQARLFGCDPDFNCYTMKENRRPRLRNPNFRSAGFHIHIGYDNHNLKTSVQLVKYLDLFLGVPSILFDTDTSRRSLYGKAGCFRLQPWGVEYRVLSSKMLDYSDMVYTQVLKAIEAYEADVKLPEPNVVALTINNNDVETAELLIKKFNIL